MVKRIYVQKKQGFDVEAKGILKDLKENLQIKELEDIIILNRYDVSGIDEKTYEKAKNTVFSEPQVDICFDEDYDFGDDKVFGVEFLPGQFDQRANSLAECLQIISGGIRPTTKTAKIYILKGKITDDQVEKIKKYIINSVDSRIATLEKLTKLEEETQNPKDVETIEGFINMTDNDAEKFYKKYGFAMDLSDLKFCQKYFKEEEKRDPTMTEMKMIDTYWSDHCRHTTFLTKLEVVDIKWDLLKEIYENYIASRKYVYEDRNKDICLMDVATIATKELKKRGLLKDLDESEEINACSIKANIIVDGKEEEYLIMFKNETHNHPTEIEPFGGAATCLGGAIRDPLSGRVYVYQAMRVTGCGDPRASIEDTLPNKLPQRKITNEAARGYSSYGNQIGLATGQVAEIYHPGYVAKRLEIGALIGAAPSKNVVRVRPTPGDKVILLGGRTGRDGCGGATGSSKAHTSESLTTCGAEVQKGNAPEERKIQRLFRNEEATKLIKRCNDFGAGGVSVAVGELADGLIINLDKVPKKYEGLDGTELAISESQERMAVVVSAEDVEKFEALAAKENIETSIVADVVEEKRIKMYWRGKKIVDISRKFLDTNGETKKARAEIQKPEGLEEYFSGINGNCIKINSEDYSKTENEKENCCKITQTNCSKIEKWKETISSLNCCSQKGLVERFDSSIGAGTVLMPFGGKHELTPQEAMCAKIPTLNGYTNACTIMSYGYDPYLSKISPFHGAIFAVVDSITKYVACGGDYKKAWLTFQEYFEKLKDDHTRWGKPLSALLGAYLVQEKLGIAAIGGKDSMSGSYNELDVPPTLVSFCVGVADTKEVVSNEFKKPNSKVYILRAKYDKDFIPNFESLKENYEIIHKLIKEEKVLSVATVRQHGIADCISKMCFGNKIGFEFSKDKCLYKPRYGTFIIEAREELNIDKLELLGNTIKEQEIRISKDEIIDLEELIKIWEEPLEKVFPTKVSKNNADMKKKIDIISDKKCNITSKIKIAKPKVFIPVFPGTNCEYDLTKAFEDAGAVVKTLVFRNLKPEYIEESIKEFEKQINEAQIIMLPGGFSAGDEPDGSGKFIASIFRNEKLKEAIEKHLNEQDGLILGICNGFQALIKLGLLPYGKIMDMDDTMPTLTFNDIARHQSKMVNTKVASKLSPWFSKVDLGEEFVIPISHGEGKFVANEETMKELIENGQIATQYVNLEGNASMDIKYNPNGSVYAVEGITSKDGRILGKMGHSERSYRNDILKNVPGNKDQKLFMSGVEYYS